MTISEWFLNSPIYDKAGRYRAFYSKRELGPVYPEITAYAISLACILFRESKDVRFLQRAKDCVEYLINLSPDGLPGHSDNLKYLFDTGIFISALFDLYSITKIETYVNEAHKRLKWLCAYFDGEKFPAVIGHLNSKDWDKVSSIHLAKLSIPLLKGWKMFTTESYRKISEQLLSWTAHLQTKEGRFRINQNDDNTRLHPHCYATEGFLFASHCINKELYWEIAKKAGDWLAKIQNEDGSFYQWVPEYPAKNLIDKNIRKVYCVKGTDTTSQAIRIWKVLGKHEENIKRAECFLENMSNDFGLPLTKGKFWFIELKHKKIYSWPTFFYIHSNLIEFGDRSKISEIF